MIKFKGIPYRSHEEWQFAIRLDEIGVNFVNEYRFDESRRYRLDFAIIDKKIGFEIEGIGPRGRETRHQRFKGYMEDCEKYNLAVSQGWRIYRIPTPWINSKQYAHKLIKFLEVFNEKFE